MIMGLSEQPTSLKDFSPSWRDMTAFAQLVWEYARGEPEQGQIAVAWTVLNRIRQARLHLERSNTAHPVFGDGSIEAACLSHGLSDSRICSWGDFSDRMYCRAMSIACLSLCADMGDPTKGATYFHDHLISPHWSKGRQPIALIGSNFFYRLAC